MHRAAHGSSEVLGDGEAEAETTVEASAGIVHLSETFKDGMELVWWNADAGISDRKKQFLVEEASGDGDLASRGELEGIPDEIKENLTDASRVSEEEGWEVWRDIVAEFYGRVRRRSEELGCFFYQLARAEGALDDFETAGFELGDIEDVV